MNWRDRDLPREEMFEYHLYKKDKTIIYLIGEKHFSCKVYGRKYRPQEFNTIDLARNHYNRLLMQGWKKERK